MNMIGESVQLSSNRVQKTAVSGYGKTSHQKFNLVIKTTTSSSHKNPQSVLKGTSHTPQSYCFCLDQREERDDKKQANPIQLQHVTIL